MSLETRAGLGGSIKNFKPNIAKTSSQQVANSSSSLKQIASANVSSSTRSSIFSSAHRTSSSTFIPAAKLMTTSDYRLNRTRTAGYGEYASGGRHFMEETTGWTKRSFARMAGVERNYGNNSVNGWAVAGAVVGGVAVGGLAAVGISAAKDGVSMGDKFKELFASNKSSVSADNIASGGDSSSAIQGNIETNQATIDGNSEKLKGYANVEKDLEKAKSDKSSLEKTNKLISDTIGNLKQSIESLQGSVDRLTAQLETVPEEQKADIQSQLDQKNKLLKQTEDRLEKEQSEFDENDKNIKELQNRVDTLTAQKTEKDALEKQNKQLATQIRNDKNRVDRVVKHEEQQIQKFVAELKKLNAKIETDPNNTQLIEERDRMNSNIEKLCYATTSTKYGASYLASLSLTYSGSSPA